jgi:4-hydroxybenzoate polyprenyltransferase
MQPHASMRATGPIPAAVELIHPAPTLAVVALSFALGAIISVQAGEVTLWRLALATAAVLGSQVATGALNDWADHRRDREARPEKPIPAGRIRRDTALAIAAGGSVLQLAASLPLGTTATLLGLAALASAVTYDLGLSRTVLSPLPYLVSFGLLPLWIAAGVGVDAIRVLPAVPLVAPFAVTAHLANTLRDFDADAAGGSRSLAQLLGRGRSRALALGLGLGVGAAVAVILVGSGRLTAWAAVPGAIGLGALGLGVRDDAALWRGVLVAAVCWTAAWALATG